MHVVQSAKRFNKSFCSAPGLFEGLPGADRACSGLQPAAGPAAPAGERRQSRQQGEGAARSVQHPHRCA